MKHFQRICAATVLSMALAGAALAGHIDTPGVVAPSPTPTPETTTSATTTSTTNTTASDDATITIVLTVLGLIYG